MKDSALPKKRIYLFDNLKAILIFLVVFFHIFEIIRYDNLFNKGLYFFVYVFHMPLFIFISGYFYNRKKTFKNIAKYIGIYILFQTLYIIYLKYILEKNGEIDFYNMIFIKPIWIMWYLVSLSVYNFAAFFINIKSKKVVCAILIINIILACLAGYIKCIGKDLSMSRNIVFFPYFLLGYFVRQNYDVLALRESFYRKAKDKSTIAVVVISLIVIAGYILYLYLNIKDLKPEIVFHNKSYASSGSNPIQRLLLYLPAVSMIFLNLLLVPNKEYKLITKVGTNTLYIFLIHGFVKYYLDMHKGIFQDAPNELVKYIVALLLTIIIIGVICILAEFVKNFKNYVRKNNLKKEGVI